ncbi:MAG: class I SAM-dependent methyltransferase, partial [Desulfobacteraceae bacterium]
MKKTVLQTIHNLLNPEWWHFEYRYWRRKTPWDTQITPPEVMEYIRGTQPGRALDLGCGTGTNAIELTRHGWQTVGVDFSPKAIVSARKKAAGNNLKIDFHVGDVTNLNFLKGPFDYVLDIGCFFTLKREQQIRYVSEVSSLTPSG